MVGEHRTRGQLPMRSAVQRCLPEKVTPELRLKHDLGRISRSRKGAGGSADAPATGTGEGGGCARTMASQRADSAIGPQRQAEVRPWRPGHETGTSHTGTYAEEQDQTCDPAEFLWPQGGDGLWEERH